MNKGYLKKSERFRVQLRPVPLSRAGQPVDRDWIIRYVDDARLELSEPVTGYTVTLGTDHVYSFMTNPARDSANAKHGFLLLHVQLILDGHSIHIEPLPPPRSPNAEAFVHPHSFRPLIVDHGGYARYFSWRPRDPLHLIRQEEPPRQLLDFAAPLCLGLRQESGLEPQFNLRDALRGEPVFELSPDFRAKWRLLGGMGDGPGDQVLVLVPRA
jgi:hypothetical protein